MSSRARKKKEEMNGNSLGVVLSPGGLAVAERSEGERSQPQRGSAATAKGADPASGSRPDPEVVAKPKRRTYTAEYKQRILEEAEVVAATRGGLGALLRREGLYSSLLTYWRACTKNASKIARQPLFMRRYSMKASITARFAPCIACSKCTARCASAAIS